MKLTDNVLAQFKKVLEESDNPQSGIRFFTAQKCCNPLLQMEVTPAPKKGDIVENIRGIDFFVTPEADKILSTLKIDYSDGSFRSEKIDLKNA